MRDFLVSVMGPWFGWLYDAYDTHALPINLAVIAYGLVIVLAWNNLTSIRRYLVRDLADQLRRTPPGDTEPAAAVESIAWERAVRATRFPLVARQNALWPRRTSVDAVRALLPAEALVAEARKALNP